MTSKESWPTRWWWRLWILKDQSKCSTDIEHNQRISCKMSSVICNKFINWWDNFITVASLILEWFFFYRCFSLVMSCNWLPRGFSGQNAACHSATDLSLFRLVWSDPIVRDFKMFSGSCIQTGDAARTGSSAGGRRGEDWNETREAKSPNLGPGFFGRQQSVKFTEFLMLVVQLPLCLHRGIVRQ